MLEGWVRLPDQTRKGISMTYEVRAEMPDGDPVTVIFATYGQAFGKLPILKAAGWRIISAPQPREWLTLDLESAA